MLTEEKIQQTRKLISKGIPEGEVKNQLKAEGYTEEEIKEIFKPKPYDMRSWLLFFGTIISLIGLYTLIEQSSFLMLILGGSLLLQYYRLNVRTRHKQKDKVNEE